MSDYTNNKYVGNGTLLKFGEDFLANLKTLFGWSNGKVLSDNNFTTEEKTKLGTVASNAEVNVIDTIKVNNTALVVTNKAVNIDIPEGSSASSTTPLMDGTASVGVELAFARGDHRHPSDTNKADIASPAFTGTPTAPTASAGTNSTQIATTAFVADAVSTAISSAYKYKGTKATYSALPASGNVTGDVWNIEASFTLNGETYPAGTNVAYTGTDWDPLGGVFNMDSYMDSTDVATIINNIFS